MRAVVRAAGTGRRTVIVGDLNSDPASPELQRAPRRRLHHHPADRQLHAEDLEPQLRRLDPRES